MIIRINKYNTTRRFLKILIIQIITTTILADFADSSPYTGPMKPAGCRGCDGSPRSAHAITPMTYILHPMHVYDTSEEHGLTPTTRRNHTRVGTRTTLLTPTTRRHRSIITTHIDDVCIHFDSDPTIHVYDTTRNLRVPVNDCIIYINCSDCIIYMIHLFCNHCIIYIRIPAGNDCERWRGQIGRG